MVDSSHGIMSTPNPAFTKTVTDLGGGSVTMCFQCGTCTASCPSGKETAYRIRKIMRQAQLGLEKDVIGSDDIWQCTTCYTCAERCPRQVEIVEVVTVLRNIAVEKGKIADGHRAVANNLILCGHTVNINDKVKAQRKCLGLPEAPPTVIANKAAMDDFTKILKKTGFDKLVG